MLFRDARAMLQRAQDNRSCVGSSNMPSAREAGSVEQLIRACRELSSVLLRANVRCQDRVATVTAVGAGLFAAPSSAMGREMPRRGTLTGCTAKGTQRADQQQCFRERRTAVLRPQVYAMDPMQRSDYNCTVTHAALADSR